MQLRTITKQAVLMRNIYLCEDASHPIVDANTGQVKAASGASMLQSVAIGSCVVIATFNFTRKIGAMAHIMLSVSVP